ncbi:DivIVA domain-containing protein [Fodinicola feengrottensis]|uniref:DivIVA domain-containing protein n=1 Tax=Fodinicola feengrottensis TaxID=435914 RepID=A0ABN2IJM8_9ACTN|nr:DivIVA domain-containing protein [Fodinicola feengrottensis]
MDEVLIAVLVAVVLAGVLFAGAAFTIGRTPGMADPAPDMVPTSLPDDRPATGADVHALRFDVVLRGYRMAQVDDALTRLAYDIDVRDTHIRALEDELSQLSASYHRVDEQVSDDA